MEELRGNGTIRGDGKGAGGEGERRVELAEEVVDEPTAHATLTASGAIGAIWHENLMGEVGNGGGARIRAGWLGRVAQPKWMTETWP